MHPDSIWAMLEAAREKNCSLSVVAKLRRDEAQGGAHWASVEYWNRKVLSIYFGKVKTGFLNLPHINVVTDASTHSQKETIASICYSHEMDSCALCPVQHVSRSKVIAPLEFDLEPEIEILAATRKVERLAAYRFLAALSHQLWQISRGRLSLPAFTAPLSMHLSPLSPDKQRIVQGNQVLIKDVNTDETHVQDLSKAMEVPILTVSIDQGGVGAVS